MISYIYARTVNSEKLYKEIAAAGLPTPTAICTMVDNSSVNYNDPISAEHKTTLDNVLSAHVLYTDKEILTSYLDLLVFNRI